MEHKLEDLIDIPLLQNLQEKLNEIYAFPSAIIDNDGKVLTAVAWQDICTKFHRTNPVSEVECIKSDKYILEHLHEANPAVSYRCPHGLIDNAIPIIIDGIHLGNFFTGQFFTENPDLSFFRRQAKRYGFNEKEYLKAVKRVPVWSDKQRKSYLEFIKSFIEVIEGLALNRLKDIQFRKLSAELPDLIYQFTRRADGSYCVPIASKGIYNVFGCQPEDVRDNFDAIAKVLHPDDAERVVRDIEYSAEHLTYFTCEFRTQIPGRPVQWILSRSTPEKLPDGSVTWYGFNANITERKKVEEELIKAKERAEESDRLKSAFLTNMSHEIRTPMNGILGFAELLKEPDLSPENLIKYINIIDKSGTRMLNIINEIVDISKIESGQMEINLKEVNIRELLDNLLIFFKPNADQKSLELELKIEWNDNEPIVITDGDKLYTIITNLIKNAIKYTDKGSVLFGVKKDTESFLFYVKDTGVGIPEARHKAIFERFVQADISDIQARQGAGLGLAIAKSYTEMLSGKIWLESKPGFGSTFYVSLPINKREATMVSQGLKNNELLTNEKIKNLKILVVEDDESSSQLISIIIKNFCKEIVCVQSGNEAVDFCRTNPDTDIVFMDILLPGMDGYEATRKIRTFNTKIIIIAQTAYALYGEREKALQAGCDDYISKPIDNKQLKELIVKHYSNKI